MDTITAGFVDGIGAAAATSGVLSQLQGRIFALLYLTPEQLSLDQIADELQQSKSNKIAVIKLNRPERMNAISTEMLTALGSSREFGSELAALISRCAVCIDTLVAKIVASC